MIFFNHAMRLLLLILLCPSLSVASLRSRPNSECSSALSKSPLFRIKKVIRLSLKGDFDRIHKANSGGNWGGEERDLNGVKDSKYWSLNGELVDLANPTRTLHAAIRARGMTSADDVAFPKLRVEINDDEDLNGTEFKGSRNFRLNTHVDTDPQAPFTEMGRLNSPLSPYREALAYEVARDLQLAAPATRLASIRYTDTSLNPAKTFERPALIIETDKKIAERYGAKIDEGSFPETNTIPVETGALFHVFNILIGNDDIGLKLKNESAMMTEHYRPFFNTTIFVKDGIQFPIVYDFDFSTFVTGWEVRPEGGARPSGKLTGVTDGKIEHKVVALANLRSRLSKAEYLNAIHTYQGARRKILQTIQAANVDEAGRMNALKHVEVMDRAIDLVNKYPMLLKDNVRFYKSSTGEADLLSPIDLGDDKSSPGTLRPGTLVEAKVSQGTIGHIEKGSKDPSVETLKKIAAALDTHVAVFFSSDDVYVFDLPRLRRKYTSADKLTPHLYMALGRVIQFAKDISFL